MVSSTKFELVTFRNGRWPRLGRMALLGIDLLVITGPAMLVPHGFGGNGCILDYPICVENLFL